MFERFLEIYGLEPAAEAIAGWQEPTLLSIPGYENLMAQVSGQTLGSGLLRFFTPADGPSALGLLKDAFPEFSGRAVQQAGLTGCRLWGAGVR